MSTMTADPNPGNGKDDAALELSSTSCPTCHDFCWLLKPEDTADKCNITREKFLSSDVQDCASCSVISEAIDFCKDAWGQYGGWSSVGGENKTIEVGFSIGERTSSNVELDFCQGKFAHQKKRKNQYSIMLMSSDSSILQARKKETCVYSRILPLKMLSAGSKPIRKDALRVTNYVQGLLGVYLLE